MRAVRIVCAAGILMALGGAGGSAVAVAPPLTPFTLVQLRVPVADVAQDGARVAWVTGSCQTEGSGAPDVVATRDVRTRRTTILARRLCSLSGAGLALGGRRVLFWHASFGTHATHRTFATVALDDRRVTRLGAATEGPSYEGAFLVGLGGDGRTLAYARTNVRMTDNSCLGDRVPCRWQIVGGAVARISGRRQVRVANVGPVVLMAVAAGRIAVVPAALRLRSRDFFIPARTPTRVEIRDATTGAVRRRISVRGRVVALALSTQTVAVLVERRGSQAVERYDARTARRLGAIAVARDVVPELAVGGRTVVYRDEQTISIVDGGGQTRTVEAASTPVGLSIEGRRVAWAETVAGRGRIRAVTL